ncbi:MAG TPA: TRAP transporter TatT component family protein [Pyrinomonadaceae bacterium]|jgi:tetratricopeptide (TPR) repeat protein
MKSTKHLRANPRLLLLIGLLLFSASCRTSRSETPTEATADKRSAEEFIKQADKLYEQREDLARAREALTMIRQARTVDFGSYDAAWRLAKFNYYIGSHATDAAEREKSFRDGIEAAEAAVKLQPERAEGHFWLGANYGGRAQEDALTGLSAIEDIRKEMETVIRLDEGFQSGSAYMVLGQLYLEAPKMLGGDPQKALEVLEKGLRFGKDSAAYHLRLAQAYLALKRKNDARRELNDILKMQPHPDFVPEYKDTVAEARKLLEKNP